MSRPARPLSELTPQQLLNRKRNIAQKEKRMGRNIFSITGEEIMGRKKKIDAVVLDKQSLSSSNNSWVKLFYNAVSPEVVIPGVCLAVLSSYLVFQYSNTPQGEISTGIVIEALGIIYATIATIAQSRMVKVISASAILATIFYTSVILHGGLKTSASKNDDHAQSLISQRNSLQNIVTSKTKMAEELPSGYVSKKQQIMNDVNKDIEGINKLNTDLNDIKLASSGDVFAGLIIRVLAMLANAYMVHLVVMGIRKQK